MAGSLARVRFACGSGAVQEWFAATAGCGLPGSAFLQEGSRRPCRFHPIQDGRRSEHLVDKATRAELLLDIAVPGEARTGTGRAAARGGPGERNLSVNEKSRKALISTIIAVVVAVLIALAGSQGGSRIGGFPVFALGVAIAFVIQWLVFIPSYKAQTEKFYDLTGALTYISITVFLVLASPGVDARGMLLAAMVVLWAARLGSFLFLRISKHGKDDRFDELKPDFFRFLNTWTIQGLWVVLTAALAWVAITSDKKVGLDWFFWVGLLVWLVGITIETAADLQKNRFKDDPANKGRFISTGLWSKSR